MKRDLDLCREILRGLEANPQRLQTGLSAINGRSTEEIAHHLDLLCEADLVWSEFKYVQRFCTDAQMATKVSRHIGQQQGQGGDRYRLTWAGHEFLDAARNDTLWNEAKRKVASTTGALAFEFVRAVLMQKSQELLGLD